MKKQRRLGVLIMSALFLFLALSFLTVQVRQVKADPGPVASFVYTPSMPTPGAPILFDASSSYDSVGTIVTYSWDFGDGSATVGASPTMTHSYPIDGNYTVQLIVTDSNGLMGTTTAVVQVNCVVFFRVAQINTLTPMWNVQVTAYTNETGTWTKAPMSSNAFEIRYDVTTQPNLAKNSTQKYHNPGYTATILLSNASNIGFELHPSNWYAYFSFSWEGWTAQWPNDTAYYYTYENGKVKTHSYKPHEGPAWDAAAGAYVMKVEEIVDLSAEQDKPIIVTLSCPVPPPQYYLTVKTSPIGVTTIPGQGLYGNGTNAVLTAPTYVNISSNTRYRFNNWDVDGTSQGAANPVTVTMNANHTATAHYVLQYLVTWTQTGLSSAATGTVATINGSANGYPNLPYTLWVDNGGTVAYSYNSIVTSSIIGQQFRLASVSGPSTPITVTGPVTVTGNYVTQYLVTFTQTGLDSSASGTVVTVNGTAKTYLALPYSYWVDSGSIVSYSYTSIVSSTTTGKQFRLAGVSGPGSPFTVTSSVTVTGNYVVQYCVTFGQTGLDSTASGTIVTVNGTTSVYSQLPYSLWVDSGNVITYSYTSIVPSSSAGKQFRLASVSGPSTPITVTGSVTVTGNYVTQYQVTFTQIGLDSTATGTVATANGNPRSFSGLPYSIWVDSGSSVTYSYVSVVSSGTTGKQFRLNTVSGPVSPIVVTGTSTVTGNYVTQYLITFAQTGLDSTATGTVLTVNASTKAYGDLSYSLWVDTGSYVSYSYGSIVSSSTTGKQFRLTGVSGPGSPFTVTSSVTVTGNYVVQYCVTFGQTGLDSTASGTIVSVNGTTSVYSQLPYSLWVDSGNFLTYSYTPIVSSSSAGKQFRLASVSGPSTPITVIGSVAVTGNYVTQYQVTFAQTGLDSSATGTVVTANANPRSFSGLPYSIWVDSGSSVTYSYGSIVSSSTTGKQFRLNTVSGPVSPIVVTGTSTVTGNYVTQYLVTFTQTGLDSSASGTVVTVNGTAKTYLALPYSYWVDSGSIISYSYNSIVSSSTSGKQFRLGSTSGASSPITVAGPTTVTGNYVVQYQVTFAQTGLDSSATGTVATVNGNPKGYGDLSFILWADSGSSVTYSYGNVTSSTVGKRFILTSVGGSLSPLSVAGPMTVTGNYKTQYSVTFGQSGVGVDFAGTVVTVDSVNYNVAGLPVQFWWDQSSGHSFAFASPLTVNASKQYVWGSTSGLSSLQSGSLTMSTSGSVTGTYTVQSSVTFDQTGVSSDFSGTVVIIDGNPYGFSALPVTFYWSIGSMHSFAFQSPLVVTSNGKQYVWTSTTGLSSVQSSGSFTVSVFGSIVGNYKTQYYLTLATSPPTVASPSGAGWHDAGTSAPVSTPGFVDIVPGSSRYRFNNWTTTDMTEIANSSATSTTVLMDKSKTLTANYVTQYQITFSQTGVGSDFTGTIVTVDSTPYTYGTLPASFWYDSGSSHSFSFSSPLVVSAGEQYLWISTTGLSSLQSGSVIVSSAGSITGNYKTQYYLSVASTYGVPGGQGWYDSGATAYAALNTGSVDHGNGTRHVFTSWSVDASGTNYVQSNSILMNGAKNAVAQWKTQYTVTFTQTGLDSSASSTVATVNSNPVTYGQLPYAVWIDSGGSVTYSFNNVSSSNSGEQFILIGVAGPASPATVTGPLTITGSFKIQYQISFSQAGVGSDFTGTIVTVDGTPYNYGALTASFWFDNGSSHTFSFASPLAVNASTEYDWGSTSGLGATTQSGTLTVAGSGSVTGYYAIIIKIQITFDPGVGTDYTGTVLVVDGVNYTEIQLPVSFLWTVGSNHTFAYQSPLVVAPNVKQYVWTSTTGLSTSQSGTITATISGGIIGYYKTQYYLTLATNPSGTNSPTGAGWYDAGTNATISTDAFVDIVPGSSRYRFNGWTTGNMGEISDPTRSPTNVSMDAGKTVTANYVVQYKVTFDQTGVGSDFNGTIVTVDLVNFNGTQLPIAFWLDNATLHHFAFQSPLVVTANGKQYVWTSTTGLSGLQSDTLLVSVAGSVIGNYKTQYYFTVTSPYDSPTPTTGWYDSGTSITASVTSPWPGATGVQYVCIGWTGTGSVLGSGSGSSMTFTMLQASSMTWNWKTQYFLFIRTDPNGIATIPGSGWYDSSASVPITAPSVSGSPFLYWDVDGISQGASVSSIMVTMGASHRATAHYQGPPPSYPSSVGGFSISLAKLPPLSWFGAYAALIVASALTLTLRKRRRK